MAQSESNQSKIKKNEKARRAQCQVSSIRDYVVMVFWKPPKVFSHFSSFVYVVHPLVSQGFLHSTAAVIPSGHPILLASLICWVLLLQLGCTFANSFFWFSLGTLTCHIVSNLKFFHDSLNPSTTMEAAPSPPGLVSGILTLSHNANLSMSPSCLQSQCSLK